MKRIVYSCPYIPPEWIAAHGLEPCRVTPQGESSPELEGLEGFCSFVRAFLGDVLRDDQAHAVIITTLCDQMRRAFDLYTSLDPRPAFLFNVPSTWQSAQARSLYANELKRLGRFLTGLGATAPEPAVLARAMRNYDNQRACQGVGQADLELNGKVRLALVGGPRLQNDDELEDILARCGAGIVLDATETGLLGTCRAFAPEGLESPFNELVDAYFNTVQHVGRRPNSQFYQRLHEALRTSRIEGIVWRRYLWCDLWHAELARARDELKLPILDLEVADARFRDRARALNRIEAFVEMLK